MATEINKVYLLLGGCICSLFASCSAVAAEHAPSKSAYRYALEAYHCAEQKGLVKNPKLTIIDYTLPSDSNRLWVLDMKNHQVLYNIRVAHGKGSGLRYAKYFSNKIGSDATSLGTFLTLNSYQGKHGYSLRVKGLEKGLDDNALRRDIVMHSAWYVNSNFAHKYDRIGRSWGCFAINQKDIRQVVNSIKGGSIIFAYAGQEKRDNRIAHCDFS